MRRKVMAVALASAFALSTGTAAAAPDFGPGNSQKGPGAKCHPPGQTTTTPGCK